MTRPPVRDEASTITVKTLGRIGAAINQADAPPPGGARFARSTRREFGMNPSHSDDPQSSGSASRASPVEDARLVGLGSLDGLAREAVLAALDRGERHEALLAAATAQPHDDAPRLIYADWLEEQGDDAQAEFIRAHCALASPHLPEGDRAALAARVEELFAERGHEWVRPLVAFGCDPAQVRLADFDRGLLASVQATVPFIAPERLFRVVPTIRRLALRGSHVRGPLFDLPHTEQLTDLTIELISADDFAALIAGKRWKSLEALALRKAWLKPEVVYSLARGAWPKLRRLSLSGSHMQNSGATALASTFLLTQLETLELASTELKSAGVLDLSRSSLAAGLKTLVLDDNGLDDDALLALADSPYLTRLRRLSLSNPELSRPPRLGRARNLFSRPGVSALVQSSNVSKLERLELLGVGLDDAGALALAAASLPALRYLDLRDNEITPETAKELQETFAERGVLVELSLHG